MSQRSYLGPLGGTLAVALALVVGGLVGGVGAGLIGGNLLFATALTWVVTVPLLFAVGRGVLDLDAAEMGVRPPDGPRRPRFVLGAVGGLVLVLVPAAVGRLAGGYAPMPSEEVAALAVPTGGAALPAVLFALPALVLAAFGEELLFRGLLLRFWERAIGARGAIVLTSLLFVGVHVANPGAPDRGGVGVFVAGIALGALFVAGRNLWVVAGAHLGWNVGEALVIGVPVSGHTLPALLRWEVAETELWGGLLGGSFGPEEGLLYHGALGLAAGALLVLAAASGAFRPSEADTAEADPEPIDPTG